jgi:hypothetical protein
MATTIKKSMLAREKINSKILIMQYFSIYFISINTKHSIRFNLKKKSLLFMNVILIFHKRIVYEIDKHEDCK